MNAQMIFGFLRLRKRVFKLLIQPSINEQYVTAQHEMLGPQRVVFQWMVGDQNLKI